MRITLDYYSHSEIKPQFLILVAKKKKEIEEYKSYFWVKNKNKNLKK